MHCPSKEYGPIQEVLGQVREAAKRGDMGSAKTLAKEIVRTKKVITRLYVNNAHLVAMVRLTG